MRKSRCLAAARRSEEDKRLAALDREVQRLERPRAVPERLGAGAQPDRNPDTMRRHVDPAGCGTTAASARLGRAGSAMYWIRSSNGTIIRRKTVV